MSTEKKTDSRKERMFKHKVRAIITAGMLVDRLQDFVLGDCELTNGQINAAKLLLDRVLPPLQALNLSSIIDWEDGGGPVLVVTVGSTEIPGKYQLTKKMK